MPTLPNSAVGKLSIVQRAINFLHHLQARLAECEAIYYFFDVTFYFIFINPPSYLLHLQLRWTQESAIKGSICVQKQ